MLSSNYHPQSCLIDFSHSKYPRFFYFPSGDTAAGPRIIPFAVTLMRHHRDLIPVSVNQPMGKTGFLLRPFAMMTFSEDLLYCVDYKSLN